MKKVQGKKHRESEAAEAAEAARKAIMDATDKENEEQRPEDIPRPEAENILGDQDDKDIIF